MATASPPDVRRGFTSPEGRDYWSGCARDLGFALNENLLGEARTEGVARFEAPHFYGGAKRRLTSGGEAVSSLIEAGHLDWQTGQVLY